VKVIDNGGSAFPLAFNSEGMSLRDWFAGMALSSMTVSLDYNKGPCNQAMAERAYVIADAMLAVRKEAASE
jgi:hypothetical protein